MMKIILTVVYALAAGLCVLAGWLFPNAGGWAVWAVAVLAVHLALGLVVAVRPLADAGRIAAWSWQGLSALGSVGLLLPYGLCQQRGWFLAVAALTALTLAVTLVFVLVLKPEGPAVKR
jgi:peptidoglycan/LPS O-acetylase OafA/YrhL